MIWIRWQMGLAPQPPGTAVESVQDARKYLHDQVDDICDTALAKAVVKKQREDREQHGSGIDPFAGRN